jgi:hypothetical protein
MNGDAGKCRPKPPLKRSGQPAELAPAYVLDEGSMSGAMVPVTGGQPML